MQWNITTKWVRGHQDQNTPKYLLPWQAQLNIRADKLATKVQFKITAKDRSQPMDLMPACKAQLKISGEIITGKIEKCIRDAWCQVKIRKFCKGKIGWNRRTFDT
eukprot:13097498-Ditylum_brightwellii.AAC.1